MYIGLLQIGVITPYEGQRAYIVSHMTKNGQLAQRLYSEIEVASYVCNYLIVGHYSW